MTVHLRFIVVVSKRGMGWRDRREGGVGRIKTIEGSKEAVKAKGQTKHMMFHTIHDI